MTVARKKKTKVATFPMALRGHRRLVLGGHRREVVVADVEESHIVMLRLDFSFPLSEIAVSESQQLGLAEPQVAFVIDCPLIFFCHREGIHGAGLDAQAAENAP